MIPDGNIILYACISRGPTILGEFSSGDERDLQTLASECIQNAPAFHRIYTHSIRNKIYIFLIEDPFAYFAIALDDDNGTKLRGIEFLGRLKDAFLSWTSMRPPFDAAESLAHGCLNDELLPTFRRLMLGEEASEPVAAVSEPLPVGSLGPGSSISDAGDDDDAEGSFEKPVHRAVGVSRGRSLSLLQKSGRVNDGGQQQARRIWRKHVWIVLVADLAICCILFTVWMSICKGFRCVER